MSDIIKDTDDLTFEQLKERNPRVMRAEQDAALGGSMDRWGDLGGITYNMQTSRYVTGHQRMRKLKEKYGNRVKIYVEQKFAEPDEYGTVGIGFVGVENTHVRFAYREVWFSEADEAAACVAANNATGVNDEEMLAQIDYELSQLENGDDLLALTGQTEDQIMKLLGDSGATGDQEQDDQSTSQNDDGRKSLHAKFTDDQLDVVYQAIETMKRERVLTGEPNSDLDANALYYICSAYVQNATSQNITPTQPELPADQPVSTAPADPTQLDQLPAA